ncbi:unnamed protein product [Leuciscus chuanchicus]
MGGVDLLDSLIAQYRTKIRSRKWYLRLFFHMMDVAMVEAWLLYRRDSTSCGVEQKEQLRLMDFKSEVASCLCKKDTLCSKRGRPSLSVQAGLDLKKRRGATAPLPPAPVRLDRIDHCVSGTQQTAPMNDLGHGIDPRIVHASINTD